MSEDREMPEWAEDFLDNLMRFPNPDGRICVSRAAELSGVSRFVAYKARNSVPEFRIRWDKVALICLSNHIQKATRNR